MVVETVADLSTLGIGDATGMAQNSGEDAKEDDEGTLTAFNGDSSFRSVEGKDTLFLKELRVRAEVRHVVFSIVVDYCSTETRRLCLRSKRFAFLLLSCSNSRQRQFTYTVSCCVAYSRWGCIGVACPFA